MERVPSVYELANPFCGDADANKPKSLIFSKIMQLARYQARISRSLRP